jgi:hypothetical protein
MRGSRTGARTLELDAGNTPQCKSNRSDGGQPDADYMTSKLVEKVSDSRRRGFDRPDVLAII